MAGIKELSVGRKDVFMVDPRILTVNDGWNVRKPSKELDEHIRKLADSIKENGVLEPLVVYLRDGKLVVVSGHCRREATLLAISEGADIKAVPVRNEEKGTNDADRIVSLITRNDGLPLTMLEKTEVVKRLLKFGWSQKEIAQKTGYSQPYIHKLLDLAESDPELLKHVKDGTISATAALDARKQLGEKEAIEAIEKVKEINEDQPENKVARIAPKHLNAENKQRAKTLASELGIPAKYLKAAKEENVFQLHIPNLKADDIKALLETIGVKYFEKVVKE